MSDPIEDAFNSLHKGNLLAAKDARIRQLEERLEGIREAGDLLWYCMRHANLVTIEEKQEAIEEWREARNHG
jgi:NTP pyrophosphatase (non-canonical NTP hydrolase)